MRRGNHDETREVLQQTALLIDFHDFVRLAPMLNDMELANEFHVDVKEAKLLRSKLERS